MAIFYLIIGLAALTLGAEGLIRGGSGIARAFGISAVVIGLTIAAYGTSTPELIVSLNAISIGKADIALGNVVGSNIFNILFILGLCALAFPLEVKSKLIKIDVPIMVVVSFLLWVVCADGNVSKVEGILLFAGIVAYTIFCIRFGKEESPEVKEEYSKEYGGSPKELRSAKEIVKHVVYIALGLLGLSVGANWFIQGAVDIARWFGLSERVIGLTIVAAGTSLPEVATSLIATIKGERDIAIGNVIGSNIYNILMILGVVAGLSTTGVMVSPEILTIDIPVMIMVAVIAWPILFTQSKISRKEGFVLFLLYIIYTVYLIKKV